MTVEHKKDEHSGDWTQSAKKLLTSYYNIYGFVEKKIY